jgi:CheY-like chemotaxis protein
MIKKKILIVEDEAIVAMENKMNLSVAGFDVVGSVSSGEDALNRLNECAPDLILMDIKLKGNISGIETVNEIRKRNNIPVLFITGNSDTKTLEQLKGITETNYLLKPVLTNDLIRTVKTMLSL